MGKIELIAKPIWRWLIVVPIGIITAYNLYRQEINPNAPPIITWLTNIQWIVWLLILFLVITIIIIEGLWRYIKESEKTQDERHSINTIAESGSAAISVGKNFAPITQQIQSNDKIEPPNILVGFIDENGLLSPKILNYIKPLPDKPDVEQIIEQKRQDLLNKNKPVNPEKNNQVNSILGISIVSSIIDGQYQASINSYPDRVEKYLEKYKKYLNDSYDLSILDDRYIELKPILENRSHYPASTVILEVYVPNDFPIDSGVMEYRTRMIRQLGRVPLSKPEEPPVIDPKLMRGGYPYGDYLHSLNLPTKAVSTRNLEIKKQQNEIMIVYRIDTLIQNRPYIDLLHIPIWLKDVNQSTKWHIHAKIYAKELPQPIENQIEIEFVILESNNLKQN